ncbi:hypothetical protein HanRHA438_Chr15g0706471 [Helianthus annuus]|nr:hypothetical protein HanHA89_Chr15g0614931 [Helianthus annuus]KAJ0844798.1 hypothetical protein HanRHA438_Chr15g0706471 [Helianthus annuus]
MKRKIVVVYWRCGGQKVRFVFLGGGGGVLPVVVGLTATVVVGFDGSGAWRWFPSCWFGFHGTG